MVSPLSLLSSYNVKKKKKIFKNTSPEMDQQEYFTFLGPPVHEYYHFFF